MLIDLIWRIIPGPVILDLSTPFFSFVGLLPDKQLYVNISNQLKSTRPLHVLPKVSQRNSVEQNKADAVYSSWKHSNAYCIIAGYFVHCAISGFRRKADENSALLSYYAASSGNSLPKSTSSENFLPTFRFDNKLPLLAT
jgi:hypothetical protein